jgi:hypothetical protein
MFAALVGISMCFYRVVYRLHHNDLSGEAGPDIAVPVVALTANALAED